MMMLRNLEDVIFSMVGKLWDHLWDLSNSNVADDDESDQSTSSGHPSVVTSERYRQESKTFYLELSCF